MAPAATSAKSLVRVPVFQLVSVVALRFSLALAVSFTAVSTAVTGSLGGGDGWMRRVGLAAIAATASVDSFGGAVFGVEIPPVIAENVDNTGAWVDAEACFPPGMRADRLGGVGRLGPVEKKAELAVATEAFRPEASESIALTT